MRYDGYGTSAFGGGLLFLALAMGGAALAILYVLANLDSLRSALAEGVRLAARGVAILALFVAGGIALTVALVAHEPALADGGEFWHLAAFMTLLLANGHLVVRWIRRRR
ncbi:MAG: hypothetical protein ACQEUM_07115 [Pseudomonadota bacterium]